MRNLDPELSLAYRPYYSFNEKWPLKPGVPVPLDIEIHRTSIVVPIGYRLVFTILRCDFEHDQEPAVLSNVKIAMKGCRPFVHNDPVDRPADIFGGSTTIHFEDGKKPYVLLPIIPV